VLCAGSALQLASKALDKAPYKLSGAVAKLASITFWSLDFPGLTNLGFLLRENSLLYSSNLPLGVPNWTVIYTITHRHSIHPKCINFPKHLCCCFSSNLCVLDTTNKR
jgi:hypothetical protein